MERELTPTFNWKRLAADSRYWLFKYKRNGREEEVRVDISIDGETSEPFIALSQKPIIGSEMPPEKYGRGQMELTPNMLNQCKDYDDCGCVVGRVALASIEGEALMSVYNSCDAQAPWSRNVELRGDFSYKNRGHLRAATTAQNFCIAIRMQCHTFPPHGNFAAAQPRPQDGLICSAQSTRTNPYRQSPARSGSPNLRTPLSSIAP